MLPVEQPFKTYTGLDGKPLDSGYIYIGAPGQDPIAHPMSVFWDPEGTIPAEQPLRTLNGYIARAGTPANVYFDGEYSIVVQDKKFQTVFSQTAYKAERPVQVETQTAATGQTVFTLEKIAYTPSIGSLHVYVDGFRMSPADYIETARDKVTFVRGLAAGQEVLFEAGSGVNSQSSIDAALIPYAPSAGLPTNIKDALDGIYNDRVNVLQFGKISNDATANTAIIRAALNSGYSDIRFPPGEYLINDTFVLPDTVRKISCAIGATISQTVDKAIWYKAGTLEAVARFPTAPIVVGQELINLGAADLAAFAANDWLLVRSGDLTPNVTAGSRVAMLRRVTTVGAALHVDAAFYRNMTMDVGGSLLQLRKATLGKRVVFEGGTYTAASQNQANRCALFDFLLCHAPDFNDVTIRDSGGAGIRLAHCVGGTFNHSHIYNLLDDRDNGHLGYGVQLAGACRGFQLNSGTIGKCRHGITTSSVFATTLGFQVARDLPADILNDVQGRGEPEACHYGPVYVYDTTNAGLDTHEQGFGFTVTPNVHGCFDGVLMRCSNWSINGGQITNPRRSGIRADFASSNATATVTMKGVINGVTITNVALQGTESYGLDLEASGANIEINNPNIAGYGVAGIYADVGVAVSINGGTVDGLVPAGQDGLRLKSASNRIRGITLKNNTNGINNVGGVLNNYRHVGFQGNVADVTPSTGADPRNDHEIPFSYAKSGRYYAGGNFGSISTGIGTVGTLRVIPLPIRQGMTLDRLATEITTAGSAGAVVRLGIYTDDGTGYPDALVLDAGTVDGTVVGVVEVPINVVLAPGMYWLGAAVQGAPATAPTFRSTTAASAAVGATSAAAAMTAAVGYGATVTGALPAKFPAGQNAVGIAPRVGVRVA